MEASANDQVTVLSPVRSSRQIVFLMLDAFALFNRSRKSRSVMAMKYRRQRISACGTKRTSDAQPRMSVIKGNPDLSLSVWAFAYAINGTARPYPKLRSPVADPAAPAIVGMD